MQERTENQEHDIKRMAMFIKHEAKEKAREIKILALEEYNTEKAKSIHKETDIIEKDFIKKKKNIEIDVITEISDLKAKYRMKLQNKKEHIMDMFIEKISKVLENKVLEKGLFNECLNKMASQNNKNNIIIFVMDRDKDNVKTWCKEQKITYKIEAMDKKLLGGIKMMSMNENTICDNSYLKRVEMLKKRHMHEIANVIFK